MSGEAQPLSALCLDAELRSFRIDKRSLGHSLGMG